MIKDLLDQFYAWITSRRWWHTAVITFLWAALGSTTVILLVYCLLNSHWIFLWLITVPALTGLIVAIRVAENDLIEKKK